MMAWDSDGQESPTEEDILKEEAKLEDANEVIENGSQDE